MIWKDEKSNSNLHFPAKSSTEKSLKRSVSPQYMSLLDEIVGQGDMVLLDLINEDSILENLRKRYEAGEIYVSQKKLHVLNFPLNTSFFTTG